MLIKCPSCGLQSDSEPGKYLCKCGTILDVAPDGTATVSAVNRGGKKTMWIVSAAIAVLVLCGIGAVVFLQHKQAEEEKAQA